MLESCLPLSSLMIAIYVTARYRPLIMCQLILRVTLKRLARTSGTLRYGIVEWRAVEEKQTRKSVTRCADRENSRISGGGRLFGTLGAFAERAISSYLCYFIFVTR